MVLAFLVVIVAAVVSLALGIRWARAGLQAERFGSDRSNGWAAQPRLVLGPPASVGRPTGEATLADTVPLSMTLPEMGLRDGLCERDSVPLPLTATTS